ncbi:lytic transglycosylase domain-containing protein [Achromobacter ruhlandii]|uniref:Transglycosylase SLT domain-containing protein n=1 Tax=Achromobacter ruhlandii TaxID=72557 RepID=A0ABM8M2S0_9BURK|nr:lytic transglycosylase domain-containing protein [Achromobacter ruhlandii]AOU95865.1 transglycosylase SLT domain-containing protein [Achromobacter ruhlandii]MCZ8431757.1 lytic transglycosylase domain-containing protein [Achromobacter ruhlandii]MDC6090394.1 lytic transglycosylase domain-containing protein [Achromobacter ruhlandii]MDC6149381.1 lytic transglycosylase domain-containing protein [Achromobacter ruhlandii]MDD7977636.1 lytic transglycosylase domain-containing protein [Achromobacter 
MANEWWASAPQVDPFEAALTLEGVDPKRAAIARSIYQQESGSGRNTTTSNAGAVGGMQIIPATFSRMADKGWNINDPLDNARAGVRYVSKLYDMAEGDPRLTAVGYYGGEGAIPKAKEGIAVSDPRNPNAPNTLQYGDQVAARIPQEAGDSWWANAPVVEEGAATTSRGPDGVLRIEMGGTNPPSPAPEQSALANLKEGATQGFGDMFAGVGQNAVHEGARTLGYIDQLFGTNLADRVKPEVAARDAEVAIREQQYQDKTPGSIAAGIGRVGGNIAAGFAGGPGALSGPMTTAAKLGATLMPNLPRTGAFLGSTLGSAALGGAYGASAPVTSGEYYDQARRNALAGALVGGVTPALGQVVGGAANYLKRNVQAAVAPFTESGRQKIAENLLTRAAESGPQRARTQQFVAGVEPTMAEITGNSRVANLQRTVRDLEPAPFVAREEANAIARQDALSAIRGTSDDLAAAKLARDATAANDYLSTHVGIPVGNTEYASLRKTPAFQSAFAEAERMAKNAGGSVETKVVNRTNLNRGGQAGKPETYVSGVGLQRIKMALDDQINTASRAGERGKAANILQIKDKLLQLMDREIPGYAEARNAYTAASKEIDAMEFIQKLGLTDAQGNVTLAKVQNALRKIEQERMKPGVNQAKAVTSRQMEVLTNLRDDLLRAGQTQAGRSLGSNTAQNLAMQNMMESALPGRAADVAGSAGPATLIGSGLGFVGGGLPGAGGGFVVGRGIDTALSRLMRGSNEDIRNRLAQLLLNEGGSGLATLNRAASAPRPLPGLSRNQGLLYPAFTVGGAIEGLGANGGR